MSEVNPHIHEHMLIHFCNDDYSDSSVYWCYKCGKLVMEKVELTSEGEFVTTQKWEVGSTNPIMNDRRPRKESRFK